jgi:hypothetical protein
MTSNDNQPRTSDRQPGRFITLNDIFGIRRRRSARCLCSIAAANWYQRNERASYHPAQT